jgi:hypothetical protein
MEKSGVNRVHYFSRQVLRTQDFEDEQAYHVAAYRRHNISHHVWGIVNGLEITQDKDQNLYVTPGVAIDGYGRELILPASRPIPGSTFDDKLADALDVWAIYSRKAGDTGDPAYQPCAPRDALSPYRWDETAGVETTKSVDRLFPDPTLGIPEYRQPRGVAADDLDFQPFRQPPDDPSVRWPVFLGRIDRVKAQGKTTFTIDTGGRPYAGARAESILAPSREAWLQVGTGGDDNPYRFAVFLGAPDQDPSTISPRLSLEQNGNWTIRGNTSIEGDLTVDGGAVAFEQGEAYATRKPWRIYRVHDTEPDPATGADRDFDELRIEMAERGAAPDAPVNQVSIGVWSAEDKKFKPCLTIADDGTVTVHGDLIVQGTLNPQTRVEAALSAEAASLAVGAAMSGVVGIQDRLGLRRSDVISEPIEPLAAKPAEPRRAPPRGRKKPQTKPPEPPDDEGGGEG